MENRYLKYFLIIGVIAVWAAIIFRIFKGFAKPNAPQTQDISSPKKDYKMVADTFSLSLNYPDPFIPEPDSLNTDSASKKPITISQNGNTGLNQQILTKEMVSGIIQYIGIISNPKKKSKIAIINIQGKEFLMKEKDKNEGVLIKKIEKNKIRITYKGNIYEI